MHLFFISMQCTAEIFLVYFEILHIYFETFLDFCYLESRLQQEILLFTIHLEINIFN